MENFITLLAWMFGCCTTLMFVARFLCWVNYDEIQKMQDEVRGLTRRFPMKLCGCIAIVCWAWILTM